MYVYLDKTPKRKEVFYFLLKLSSSEVLFAAYSPFRCLDAVSHDEQQSCTWKQ